jgi:hypothetical protein
VVGASPVGKANELCFTPQRALAGQEPACPMLDKPTSISKANPRLLYSASAWSVLGPTEHKMSLSDADVRVRRLGSESHGVASGVKQANPDPFRRRMIQDMTSASSRRFDPLLPSLDMIRAT